MTWNTYAASLVDRCPAGWKLPRAQHWQQMCLQGDQVHTASWLQSTIGFSIWIYGTWSILVFDDRFIHGKFWNIYGCSVVYNKIDTRWSSVHTSDFWLLSSSWSILNSRMFAVQKLLCVNFINCTPDMSCQFQQKVTFQSIHFPAISLTTTCR